MSAERAVHKLRVAPGDGRIEYRTALSNLQLKYIMCLIHVDNRVSLNMMWQKDCFAISWSNLVVCYYNLSLEPDLLRYRLSQPKQQVVSPCFIALNYFTVKLPTSKSETRTKSICGTGSSDRLQAQLRA